MKTRTIVALFFGCLSMPLIAAGTEGKACNETTELDCLQSKQCTLVQTQVHGKYTCRDAVGHCEIGFRQSADYDIQKDCEAKPGCEFKIANCFCPPNLECACGGGPPAQCVEKKKSR
jgi:hypothetical protein